MEVAGGPLTIASMNLLGTIESVSLTSVMKARVCRFLLFGLSAALVNLALIFVLIEVFQLSSPFLRNVANIISLELSLLYSFVVYRLFVWNSVSGYKQGVLSQIVRYHMSSGGTLTLRSFVLFPLLDLLGVHFLVNTLIGVVAGCVLSYLLSDRYVFRPLDCGEQPKMDNMSISAANDDAFTKIN